VKTTCVWLQEEWLSASLIAELCPAGATLIYIFDETWLAQRRYSLKRIQFIYEALLDLPEAVEIYRGEPSEILHARRQNKTEQRYLTFKPRDPELRQRVLDIAHAHDVEHMTPPRWIPVQSQSFKRFFKFYNVVKRHALDEASRDKS